MCTAVVTVCNCPESLLTSSIPLKIANQRFHYWRLLSLFLEIRTTGFTYNLEFNDLRFLLHRSNFLIWEKWLQTMKTKHQKLSKYKIISLYLQSQHRWYLCSSQRKNHPIQMRLKLLVKMQQMKTIQKVSCTKMCIPKQHPCLQKIVSQCLMYRFNQKRETYQPFISKKIG